MADARGIDPHDVHETCALRRRVRIRLTAPVYILGSGLEALPLIAPIERELKVPVVQAIAARIWEIERRLKVHVPIKGYGRLLETLPA